MATITASLERSLQNCSLNPTTGGGGGGVGRSKSSNSSDYHQSNANHNHNQVGQGQQHHNHNHETATASNASSSCENSTFVELNSHISLPYHWEQCLDLKTGELYYINWSNMMKVKEDPRTTTAGYNGDYDYEDEDEDEDDEDDDDDDDDDEEEEEEENNNVGYDSEGSSTESYRSSSTRGNLRSSLKKLVMGGSGSGNGSGRRQNQQEIRQDSILVVAGCKSCLMYHMVPKHLEICPKCAGQLLHFPPNNPTS